jgi:CheY-like chemotaxis protein
MSQPIKILIVEDDANDAELMVHELYRAGFDPHWLRVETEADYLNNLSPDLDLILSDYAMPQFSGLRALALLKQRGLEIPFIIVSSTIDEATAVTTMHQGATDYLLKVKDRIARLGRAVCRAMKEVEERAERGRLEAQFIEVQKMEVIGQLASGLAHDFNNILVVIMGYSDLMMQELGPDDPLRKHAEENARSKIVFSLEGKENLEPLVYSMFMGVINLDETKLQLFSRKVMDYAEETRTIRSESENWSEGVGEFTGTTDTESAGGAMHDGAEQEARLWNISNAASGGTSRTSMKGGARGETTVPFLRPVFGSELSSVQYRSLEEQVFRAMATLSDQQQRHGVAKLVGMRSPFNIVTPTVTKMPTSKEMIYSFLTRVYEKLPFALKSADAQKQIEAREQKIAGGLRREDNEAIATRRKLFSKS